MQSAPQTAPKTPLPLTPVQPNYGRWTVTPGAAQAPATNLADCTPQSLSTLTGAAHDACAKRLSEQARNAPALPPIADPHKAKALDAQTAYAEAVRAWRNSSGMGPHPCPPQDEPAHKLYLDKCSLVNAARQVNGPLGPHPGLKVEFKIRF